MLVLSRKIDQSVIIGDDVEIIIIDVCDGKVYLEFIAPDTISVFRKPEFDPRIEIQVPPPPGDRLYVLQVNETVMIGGDVEIQFLKALGTKARLGVTAPKTITVHRKEVYETIQLEKASKQD